MIAFSERVHVALDPVDFRLGLDGLGLRAQAVVGAAVFTDTFVFFNRGRDRVKILRYDRFGFWLCYQRLARGHYARTDRAQGKRPLRPSSKVQLNLLVSRHRCLMGVAGEARAVERSWLVAAAG